MKILAIDTSCDETSAAITDGRRVLSNVIYSQVLIHKKWGGVVPSLAKRAHEERIDFVIEDSLRLYIYNKKNLLTSELASRCLSRPSTSCLSWESEGSLRRSFAQTSTRYTNFFYYLLNDINYLAVTQGPGLAVALEVGIEKAKQLAEKFKKKLIAVNHMEGHIYSCFVQNRQGNPPVEFKFPYLALLISGGHTQLFIFKNHLDYRLLGETIDDAAGEALDKAAKMLELGYPGGAVIERLATEVNNRDFFKFPRPMLKSANLNFSFSGLKTSFYYFIRKLSLNQRNQLIKKLASSYQEAVFDTLIFKTEQAIKKTAIKHVVVGGGVSANLYLRKKLRQLIKKYRGEILFPPFKYLTGDNAAMIGVAAYYKAKKDMVVKDVTKLDRVPRLGFG